MAALCFVPVLGTILQKTGLAAYNSTAPIQGEAVWRALARRYRAIRLSTYDGYGAHAYQHYPSEAEVRELVAALQPDPAHVKNAAAYYARPRPLWAALRVFRT